MFGSEKPAFNNSSAQPPNGTNNLTVASQFTVSDVTEYFMAGLSDPIVSYNGSILAKNIEYSAVTSGVTQFIQLLFSPLDNQILTYAYIQDGASSDLIADLYTVSSISSGATGTQSQNDRVFYNTTTGKYEFYLVSVPASDVLLSINGSTLVKDVEYYSSISNSRRIILEEPLISGDIIQAFYQPKASASGGIASNNLNVSWVIDSQPTSLNGKFTIEVTTPSDINFQNIVYTEIIDYVIGQRSYSKQLLLTNAVAGDKFIYRVKNEKFYTPIIGVTIYSVEYSDTVNIEILTNSGNSY
jgi:hypothetical protein